MVMPGPPSLRASDVLQSLSYGRKWRERTERETPGDEAKKWTSLLKRIVRATGKPDKAEDYLHSAFVRLEMYRLQKAVRNPEGLLVKIAANLAIDESRRERFQVQSERSTYDILSLASPPAAAG